MAVDPLVEQVRQHVQVNYPIATLESLSEAENLLGFTLPSLLRALYLNVGNGGYGPSECTLIGLQGGHQYYNDTLASLYNVFRSWKDDRYIKDGVIYSLWPEQLLPAFIWPCNIYSCIDCSQPESPVYVYDANLVSFEDENLPCPIMKHKESFSEWLGAIITEEDLWSEIERLSSEMAEKLTEERRSI